jgi:hypothetical protein
LLAGWSFAAGRTVSAIRMARVASRNGRISVSERAAAPLPTRTISARSFERKPRSSLVTGDRRDRADSRRPRPYGVTLSEAVPLTFCLLARIVVLPTFLAVTRPLPVVRFITVPTDLGVTSHLTWKVTSRIDPPEK